MGTAGHLDTPPARHERGAARRHREPGQGPDHRRRHRPARSGRGPRRRGRGAGPGRAADPGQPARRDRPRGDGGRPGQGAEAAGDRGEVRPGGAVGRGLRERRAGGPGAARRTRCWRSDDRITAWARRADATPGWTAGRTRSAPAPTWTCSWAPTPAPAAPAQPAPGRPARRGPRGVRQPGHPDRPAGHPDRPRRTGPASSSGLGPVDPWLARDLAAAAARNPKTTWCLTVTDNQGHAIGHGCARPEPKSHRKRAGPGPPGFCFTPASRDGPPGSGYGTWRLRTPGPGPDLIITLDPVTTDPCDHRHQASGHDPGARLRHLSQVRHATCTSPVCRRPAAQCDHEHNTPYEAGGRTCLCNTGPKCRHDHRLKQHPRWKVDQLPDGTFRWTTPAGRTYTTEPTRYPI